MITMQNLSKCRDPKSISEFLKRASICHKRSLGITFWDQYLLEKTKGWVSTRGRFFGVGYAPPKDSLGTDEHLVTIDLPWYGSGRDVYKQLRQGRINIKRYGADHYTKHFENADERLEEELELV